MKKPYSKKVNREELMVLISSANYYIDHLQGEVLRTLIPSDRFPKLLELQVCYHIYKGYFAKSVRYQEHFLNKHPDHETMVIHRMLLHFISKREGSIHQLNKAEILKNEINQYLVNHEPVKSSL